MLEPIHSTPRDVTVDTLSLVDQCGVTRMVLVSASLVSRAQGYPTRYTIAILICLETQRLIKVANAFDEAIRLLIGGCQILGLASLRWSAFPYRWHYSFTP
jgi:hypothetical protein